MKKLLLILILIFAGIICQAQEKRIYYRPDAIRSVIDEMFDQIYQRVDSLEKRIIELENNCLVMEVDSTAHHYGSFEYPDSLILKYEKYNKIVSYKKLIIDDKIKHLK